MKRFLARILAVLMILLPLCPSALAAERVRSIPVKGVVFRVFSDEFAEGAVVEVHKGRIRYLEEAYNDSWKIDDTQTYQDDEYSDEPLASTVTGPGGVFSLDIPLKAKPLGYKDEFNYTLVISKEGWFTQYVKIHFDVPEKSANSFTSLIIPFAPESASFELIARTDSGMEQSTGKLFPYTRVGISPASTWNGYMINEVELYLDGELYQKWTAPAEQKDRWIVCSLNDGVLYVMNQAVEKDYEIERKNSFIVYPSWMRAE